ncbi:peptidoglycan-binding protein, partial [Streptomyces lunaelactis]
PTTEQGREGPLHGPSGKPAAASAPLSRTTRAEIINRAKKWVSARVPYSMEKYWSDGYRQDCSGFVSMAWNLAGNEWTGSLAAYGTRITREELQPGDMLLFHNLADPTNGSHVVLFGGWTDYTHSYYMAYEQTKPYTRHQATPMAYWTNSGKYLPYRYNGITGATATASASVDVYPGGTAFGPGADNEYVTRLGELLVARGGKRFYTQGPGPRWGEADRRATRAFQLAQGWRGTDADGMPGPATWRLLVTGQGKDIPGAGAGAGAGAGGPGGTSAVAPKYPGRGYFRPGQSNAYVTQLGRQLVKRGFGKQYTSGPGPRWGEADRRGLEAFQRAQGWRGAAADGFPGPETWRRLFA